MNYYIIAAGSGSRLVGDGIAVPKPLVDLCGQPAVGRLAEIFAASCAHRIAVIVNESMPEVARYLNGFKTQNNCALKVVVKNTPSSMHSLAEIVRAVPPVGKFVVTTVDTVFDPAVFAHYVTAFQDAPADVDGLMGVTTFVDDEKPLYVSTRDDGTISGFHDRISDAASYVSAGVYGLTPAVLPILENSLKAGMSRMRNFQRELLRAGFNLKAFDLGKVVDIDHASDIETARQLISVHN